MSPVIGWLSMLVKWVTVFVMFVSSVPWFGSVVSLGGMLMLVICRCFVCAR